MSHFKVPIFAPTYHLRRSVFPQKNFSLKLVKKIKSTATELIANEASAIAGLVAFIDTDFVGAVERILNMEGRLVVTGIGKSGLIGQKLVGTFNSTGTPAIFMHAADAIHGDLGMVRSGDVVLAISKSGETPEIKALVPFLKRLGVPVLGMVGNKASYLGVHSDNVLCTFVPREADLYNLVPTSSTTATLVLGDAMAICLAEARGFSPQDFAGFHPGGTLGKRLHLKVSDLYPSNLLPTVRSDASLREVIVEISSKCLGATAVLESDGSLAGIITDGDLRRMLNLNAGISDNLFNRLASEIMTRNPVTISADAEAQTALELMQSKSISQLLVTEGKDLKGVIHLLDLVREGLV
jgi:arabinose-5-phosphate isomerase